MTHPGPVFNFDTHDPLIAKDPYPTYTRMRSTCPVTWSEAWGGFWVFSGHAEVSAGAQTESLKTGYVLADGTVQGVSTPALGQTGRLVPLEMDAPQCLKFRRLLATFYSPGRVRARMSEFREVASACVSSVIESRSCDVVRALTSRMPGILTMRDMGLPESWWDGVNALVHQALLSPPHDLDGAREGALLVCQMIIEALERCRRAGGDGTGSIIDHLLSSQIDGCPVSDNDIVSMVYLLILGVDPTSTLTATALWYLAKHPELRRKLAADVFLIPKATEEFLRWVSPIQGTGRTLAGESMLANGAVQDGERVLLMWASANRDDAVFKDADRVDLDRDNSRHLAFGRGVHYCLGANMVRAMCNVMLEEILTRVPEYEVAEEATEWFPDLSSVYGVKVLQISAH